MDSACRQDEGESPLFPPVHPDLDLAVAEVEEVLHHTPLLYGLERANWWLDGVRQVIAWMHDLSLAGVCKLLQRLHVCYKRGRAHVHSPDLDYDKKLAIIDRAQKLAEQAPEEVVFLYEDELTFYSRPLVGRSYSARGRKGAKASGHALKTRRIAACLDVATGEVIARQRDRFNVKEMYRFFFHVEQHYPLADVIYIALDNWPVHFHAYVQDHLARRRSRIRLLRLPTYAPWTNPVEKLWLKLSQHLLTQHHLGTKWETLKQTITNWFLKYAPCHEELTQQDFLLREELLHFVGLLPDEFVKVHYRVQ